MGYKLYPIIICPNTTESECHGNIEKVFITKKCTQCKTSHTLKTDFRIIA